MRRLVVAWIINSGTLLLLPLLMSSVRVEGLGSALLAALVLGLLNAVVRPLLVLLTLPFTLLTLGLFLFVINGITFWLASDLVAGFSVGTFGQAILAAALYSVISSVVGWLVFSSGTRVP